MRLITRCVGTQVNCVQIKKSYISVHSKETHKRGFNSAIDELCLKIKFDKSCYITFSNKKYSRSSTIIFLGKHLVRIQKSIYFQTFICETLNMLYEKVFKVKQSIH